MTKAVTGTAAMQLVERGRLHLDAPASSVLPNLADAGVLEGFDDGGQPVVRPARAPITLRHLLTHTSGFGYDTWSEPLLRYQQAAGTVSMTSGELVATTTMPALFDPGEGWMYGISIDIVGRMVEEVSGRRLDHYFDEHILGPLGMGSTSFGLSDALQSRSAAMHARRPDGSLAAIELARSPEPKYPSGGGGLYSTVEDYCRFLQMILGRGSLDGVAILQPETVDRMTVNNIGDLRVVALPAVRRELTNDAEFFPGVAKTWGLTFQINEEPLPTGRPAAAHVGRHRQLLLLDRHGQSGRRHLHQPATPVRRPPLLPALRRHRDSHLQVPEQLDGRPAAALERLRHLLAVTWGTGGSG